MQPVYQYLPCYPPPISNQYCRASPPSICTCRAVTRLSIRAVLSPVYRYCPAIPRLSVRAVLSPVYRYCPSVVSLYCYVPHGVIFSLYITLSQPADITRQPFISIPPFLCLSFYNSLCRVVWSKNKKVSLFETLCIERDFTKIGLKMWASPSKEDL